MACGDFKDFNRRTAADEVLGDKAFNIAKNLKYDGHRCGLASIVYKFFDKKTSGGIVKNEIISIKEFAELSNQLLENLRKEKYTHLL